MASVQEKRQRPGGHRVQPLARGEVDDAFPEDPTAKTAGDRRRK